MAKISPVVHLAVKISKFTKARIDNVESAVMERDWAAKKYGVSVSYDWENDKVSVATDAPASSVAALKRQYPGGIIDVQSARFETQANRFNDSPPFWGGAFLTNGAGTCTAGVHVKGGDGGDYMTTAAHCYDRNNEVWNDWNQRRSLGAVTIRFSTVDTEVIKGSGFGNSIFIGGYAESESALAVGGTTGVSLGLQVNVSGQKTYQHGGHPISNTNYSICWDSSDCITDGNAFLYDQGGSPSRPGKLTESGDSGAPIYVERNGKAMIVGLHSGRELINNTWHMVGVKIDPVLNALGATLAVN